LLTLLIADDEPFVRTGLIKNLNWNELGVDLIEQADDGVNAYEKALALKPDIIVTDVRMPRMDGIELAVKVKESMPDCKIIFMSAYSDKQYLKSAINLKAVNYIEKPIDPLEISKAIAEAVSSCNAEKNKRTDDKQSKESLKKSLYILKNNIANELIQDCNNYVQIENWLNTAGVQLPAWGIFCVILARLGREHYSVDTGDRLNNDILLRSMEDVISLNGLKCISGFKDTVNIISIIYADPLGNALSSKTLEKVCRDILAKLAVETEAFICSGTVVTGIGNICKSYQSAVIQTQYLFFEGYGNISISELNYSAFFKLDDTLLDTFTLHLDNCEKEELLQMINDLTQNIKPYKNTPVNYVKDIYFKLLLQITNSASKRRINLFSEDSEGFLWETVSSYNTLDEIHDYLINLLNIYFKQIEEVEGTSRVISDITAIISRSYADSELSIKFISDKLFLSHSYLCVFFKKETGKTINQYITEYRIKEAKELLKDQYVKMYEVSTSVGYTDQNYFTKIFKKVTHLTPSEYREKCIK